MFSESRSPLRAQTAPTLEAWRPSIARLESNWPTTLSTTLTRKLINDGGPSLSGPFRFRFESAGIQLNSDFEIENNAFLAATYDLSRTWNIGLYVPIFPVRSFGTRSQPNLVHNFGPWSASHRTPGDADDVSIGNVVFQTHYNFPPKRPGWPELGILSLVTLPTADRDSLPGFRETNFLTLLMASRSFGRLAPHVNLGFDWTRNGSEQHSLFYGVGLTANVQPNLTLALDVFGRRGPAEDGIEEHAVDLALGATWHLIPAFLLNANARLLMNHRDDLRPGIISTVGFEYKF
jgi:hypothetical protein